MHMTAMAVKQFQTLAFFERAFRQALRLALSLICMVLVACDSNDKPKGIVTDVNGTAVKG